MGSARSEAAAGEALVDGWAGGEGRGSPVPADARCPVLRYRKMKERLGLTEIRKQANRMSFGEVGPRCAPGLSL